MSRLFQSRSLAAAQKQRSEAAERLVPRQAEDISEEEAGAKEVTCTADQAHTAFAIYTRSTTAAHALNRAIQVLLRADSIDETTLKNTIDTLGCNITSAATTSLISLLEKARGNQETSHVKWFGDALVNQAAAQNAYVYQKAE